MPAEDMWDGFDRFLKTQEVGGDLALTLREFKSTSEQKMRDMSELISKRVTEDFFNMTNKRYEKKMKEYIDKKVGDLTERC